MLDRRHFLGALAIPAALAAMPALRRGSWLGVQGAFAQADDDDPEGAARDEALWRAAQNAFDLDRSIVNLNSGGVSPTVGVAAEAMQRHLEFSNAFPPHNMWSVLEPRREGVRAGMAAQWKCDAEELAFTRNASEGLQTCQFGLDLQRGDEMLTTTQDYPRMLNTFRQREQREGLVLKQISLPVPLNDPREVLRRYEAAITDRTRMILVSHMINLTGQILPVREIAALGRKRGIPVIVDGAHSLAHFDFALPELDCDYYATSLHKWLFAPVGTGLLYVRRDKIAGLWPLMAANDNQKADIRKFEEIGTHPAANTLAIAEALTFHQTLGPKRKAARLRFLRDRWVARLLEHDRVQLNTNVKSGMACGIANFRVEGIDSAALQQHLWSAHRIYTTPIVHEEFHGIRVSPSVWTTLAELDRFGDAVEKVLREGLPG